MKEIERYKKSHKLLLNYSSIDDKVDMAINNPDIKKDDRRQNVKINDYHTEGYNLFRLELSLFLEKNPDIKNKIIKIVRDKDTKKNKKRGII